MKEATSTMSVVCGIPCQNQHHHDEKLHWQGKLENTFEPTSITGFLPLYAILIHVVKVIEIKAIVSEIRC